MLQALFSGNVSTQIEFIFEHSPAVLARINGGLTNTIFLTHFATFKLLRALAN